LLVNNIPDETTIPDALLVSPAVKERFNNDLTGTTFLINDEIINAHMFSQLSRIQSESAVELSITERKSILSLCRYLKNDTPEKLIIGLSIG
jgi:hypothetical protein